MKPPWSDFVAHNDRKSRGPEVTRTGSHADRKSRGPDVTRTGSHADRKSRGQEVTRTGCHADRKSRGPEVTRTGSHADRKSRGPEVTRTGSHADRHTPPHDASVRGISWRAPAGINVRQYRSKKYNRTQKLRKRWPIFKIKIWRAARINTQTEIVNGERGHYLVWSVRVKG